MAITTIGITHRSISIIALAVGKDGTLGVGTLIVNGIPNKGPITSNPCRSGKNVVSVVGMATVTVNSTAVGAAGSADAAINIAETISKLLQFDADPQLDHAFDGDFEILDRTAGVMR